MYDVIIIGAGIGGLACASKLAVKGKKVLLLEKIYYTGGSSHIFKRGGFIFPTGPLSFSHPDLVKKLLKEAGIPEEIQFHRSHFQLITPDIDIIYSQNWERFEEKLKVNYPEEKKGIEGFFREFNRVLEAITNVIEWHPDFIAGKKREKALEDLEKHQEKHDLIQTYSNLSSKELLDKYLKNDTLKRLLGSQGSYDPIMNVVHLAFMWNVMSIQGIWFPSCRIDGINDLLAENITKLGGNIKTHTEVAEIIIEDNKAVGVKTKDGNTFRADWIVCNADYKQVFLELINTQFLPKEHIDKVRDTPYTGSELCVFLGIDPNKIDVSKMRADHLFYRPKFKESSTDPTDFENKEIEICLWSDKSEGMVPDNYKSLILRVNMPYDYFSDCRIDFFKRKEGYKEKKQEIVNKLIMIVEEILPGLSDSIVKQDAATPLTYRDFISRHKGSVAGWTRDIKKMRLNSKLLMENPINNLLLVGIYSVVEPFLGGYPVSMYSGILAADLILERN